MARLLWWLLLALAIGWWWQRRAGKSRLPPQPPGEAKTPAPRLSVMVRCAHCGVHLPESEAVVDAQGVLYCSTAHRDAAAARTPPPAP